MATVMVIGASRGIGLELARQYLQDGWRVHATTRTPDEPGELGALAGDLVLHELDVRNADQIAAVAEAVAGEGIDVLIHNAGVFGTGMSREEVMRINVEAPFNVVQSFFDSVLRGEQKKIVLMSSDNGARQGNPRSRGTYADSKAELNDRFRALEDEWGRHGVNAIVLHPGWVKTDMGGPGARISVEESITGIRRVIAGLGPAQHGRFWTWEGHEHPW